MKIKLFLFLVLFTVSNLPTLKAQDLPPAKIEYSSVVLSSEGNVIGYIGEKNRYEVKGLSQISKHVVNALIATEDRDFYNHDGVSYKGLARAIFKTLTGSTQGGSTLTMQLARNLYLSTEQTISRKFTEINIARELEKRYKKDQILLMYLNTVNFGHGAWGIFAASQMYFGKNPDKLNVTESCTLVGLLKNPNGYDAEKNPDRIVSRRNEVMYNLVETGKLSDRDFQKFKSAPLGYKVKKGLGRHFVEHVRKEAAAILSSKGISLNRDQIKITTTLNYELQNAAEEAVKNQYSQVPDAIKQAQVGLIAVEPGTGKIRAMIGGNPDSDSRGLNHADEIYRQPGSSFKAFLYGSLLEQGYSLATPILDAPIIVDSGTVNEWRPSNSDDTFSNAPMPMITAIQHSVNAVAARAIVSLTNPDSVVSFAHRLGIKSEIPSYPSIALGTADVSPLEMAAAFAVFASEGTYAKPYSIVKIEDKNNHVLYSAGPETSVVLDSASCYLLTQAFTNVVDGGTAASVRKFYRGTAAGKTGTTQNSTDVWFVGYNPMLSTAIWVGYDNPQRKLYGSFRYGGTACAPIWGKMMAVASGKIKGFYGAPFIKPESVQDIELCEESGKPADSACPKKKVYPVNFLQLKGSCDIHSTHVNK